jgi:oxygen-dependent protoporphyrinogen oxidase
VIAIAGAGLTGLALGHELARRGVPHVVLEAADQPGGVIRSETIEGRVLEWGPQRGRLTDDFARLIEELGLADQLILAPPDLPLYVYAGGRLRRVPFTIGGFVSTDLLGWGAKARILLEPLTAGPRGEESVGGFFRRKLGKQAFERLIGPLYGGLYASDPDHMVVGLSLAHALRGFNVRRSLLAPLLRRGGALRPPAACSFAQGMQTLTDALCHRNRDNIRLSTPVHGLRREEPTTGRWVVETAAEDVRADRVVLTCPASQAAEILEGVASDAAGRLGRLTYNPLAVVHLHAETGLRGMGYQVALDEDMATRGVTWNDCLFDREGVYTVYLGGATRPEVVDEDDDRIAERAIREFEAVTGCSARPLAVERERMPAWDASWSALTGLDLPAGVEIASNYQSRPGMPGRLAQARRLGTRFSK